MVGRVADAIHLLLTTVASVHIGGKEDRTTSIDLTGPSFFTSLWRNTTFDSGTGRARI